ncbi:MAG TPA: hypothetical protein VGJ25_05755 [Gaiellaceae bacterium]|jgi:hypothetical protein
MSLERDLHALAAELEWPEPPPLAQLELGRRRNLRPLVLALAVLVLALAVALAVPPARSAILRFLHLRGVTVERVETLPPAPERPLVAGLGPARSLDEAARVAGFAPVLPPGVTPSRVYARWSVIAIPLGDRRLLTELSGIGIDVSKKFAAEATRVEPVTVAGARGIWIEGGPHVLVFRNRDGRYVTETLRLAGNTLLWERGTLTLRLEGPLTLPEALRIARSIQRGPA